MEAFKNQSCLGVTVVGSLFANEPANVLQAESQVSLSCTMSPQEVVKLFSKFSGVGSHSSSESRTTKAKLSVIRRNSMILLNIFEAECEDFDASKAQYSRVVPIRGRDRMGTRLRSTSVP